MLGSDPQFGLMANYPEHKETRWEKEKILARQCVEKINNLSPKPKFFVICGDLCDALPGNFALLFTECFYFIL